MQTRENLLNIAGKMIMQVHIAQRGAITPLIKMLESSDEQVMEMSAFALGRLAQVLFFFELACECLCWFWSLIVKTDLLCDKNNCNFIFAWYIS